MTGPVRNVLVLGGSGFVGRALIARLVERWGAGGGRITVPTRRLGHARALQTLPTVDVVQADVHDISQLAHLVRGRDAVVNLVATLHGDADAFARVHVELPRRIARACVGAGVRRLVHVSALGVARDAPSLYLRSKWAGETVLREAADAEGAARLDLTLLRPSVMFGEEDRLLNLFARLQAAAPVVPLAAADAKFQPVWVDDVALAIVRCLERRETFGRTYECVGPQVVTLADLVRLAGRCSGHPRPVLALPPALGRLQARMMEWAPGQPLMSRDNLASMQVPNVASGTLPDLGELDITPAALEAVAPTYLARAGAGRARLDALRAAAPGR
jgi:NADH dehydrogenase